MTATEDLLLPEHHRAIERVCRDLVADTYAGDPLALVAQYRRFEQAVLEHLAAEESAILPAYEKHAPADAQAIRDDHAAIRDQLFRIAMEVELHLVRAATVNAMMEKLRTHAEHEDAGLYPWAQEHLTPPARSRLLERIRASLHALARPSAQVAAHAPP